MKTKIIYFRESWWQSILSDLGTLLTMISAMAINHFWLGDNELWTAFFIAIVLIVTLSRTSKNRKDFTSYKQLKEYIDYKIEIQEHE